VESRERDPSLRLRTARKSDINSKRKPRGGKTLIIEQRGKRKQKGTDLHYPTCTVNGGTFMAISEEGESSRKPVRKRRSARESTESTNSSFRKKEKKGRDPGSARDGYAKKTPRVQLKPRLTMEETSNVRVKKTTCELFSLTRIRRRRNRLLTRPTMMGRTSSSVNSEEFFSSGPRRIRK